MVRTLFSRRYIAITLFVLLAMAVMARLGVWQLDRRQQRLARNADLIAKLEQPPLSLNDVAAGLAATPADRDEIRNTRAAASGRFDYEHQLLLVQQVYQDSLGSRLLTPLVLNGSDKAVLVDRGGRQLPVAADFAAARVSLPAARSLELARADDGRLSFRIDEVQPC